MPAAPHSPTMNIEVLIWNFLYGFLQLKLAASFVLPTPL
jgi:hypothetical protein